MHVKNKIRRTTTSFDFESSTSKDPPPTPTKPRETKYVRKARPTIDLAQNGSSSGVEIPIIQMRNQSRPPATSSASCKPQEELAMAPTAPQSGRRFSRLKSVIEEEERITMMPFTWYWPFTEEGVAKGEYTEQKFYVRLPFRCGTNNEHDGTIMKVDKISEFNYCWTIGLSTVLRDPYKGNPFWRIEIEIVRNLNSFILFVCREIWSPEKKNHNERRFKKLRRVYKLPHYYDVSTLKTACSMDSFLIEVFRRRGSNIYLRRSTTFSFQ